MFEGLAASRARAKLSFAHPGRPLTRMDAVETSPDLKQLPLFALLALAVRCARRVQPLFRQDDQQPAAEPGSTPLDRAIRLAEDISAGRNVDPVELCSVENDALDAAAHATQS